MPPYYLVEVLPPRATDDYLLYKSGILLHHNGMYAVKGQRGADEKNVWTFVGA